MKTGFKGKRILSVTIVALFVSTAIFAQGPGCGYGKCQMNIPDLTEEQNAKIDELRIPHMQTMSTLKAELNVLKAELRQLEIATSPDRKKIDSKIDEISAVQNKIAKEKSKHRQSVRSLLTAEQKIYFDARGCKGPNHSGQAYMKHQGMNCPQKHASYNSRESCPRGIKNNN